MPDPEYSVRSCTAADAATVARHRVAMFRDMGQVASDALAQRLLVESAAELERALLDGSYVGWLALDAAGLAIAGAGCHIMPQLPRLTKDGRAVATGPTPLVVNVYTDPAWRRRGIARTLMNIIRRWAEARRFDRVSLHASDDGRPLYESLGFEPTNEMRWAPVRWDLGHDD